MSAAVKAAPPITNGISRRTSTQPGSSSVNHNSRSPTRPSTPSAAGSSSSKGMSKTKSVRDGTNHISARAAAKKPASATSQTDPLSPTLTDADEDAKAEAAALIKDLKASLQKAESASEQYQKQLAVIQIRLDEAMQEHAKLEERYHENEEHIESLQHENQDSARKRRELEEIYEAERNAWVAEKEETLAREEQLHEERQRWKGIRSHRTSLRPGLDDKGLISRSPSVGSVASNDQDESRLVPSLNRSESRNNSKLLLQKDKIIESLRLELAEAQIKVVEVENMGGGQVRELQSILLETKIKNARLMEENESFQLLLGERTLNGEFSKSELMQPQDSISRRPSSRADRPSNLADELASAVDADPEGRRRVEIELEKLKDENVALTLYINNIIGRLLKYNNFEGLFDISNRDETLTTSVTSASNDLRPPPAAVTSAKEPDVHNPGVRSPAPSLLQRAKSVMGSTASRPRARPTGYMPSSTPATIPSIHNDAETHISPPLPQSRFSGSGSGSGSGAARHRRANSEWTAGAIVNNMYRGPPPTAAITPTGQLSPGFVSPRSSFFGPAAVAQAARIPSGSSSVLSAGDPLDPAHARERPRPGSRAQSTLSDSDGMPSPARSVAGSSSAGEGKVLAGNRPIPLRLVQENQPGEEAGGEKRNNRGSWMGWFGKGKPEEGSGVVTT